MCRAATRNAVRSASESSSAASASIRTSRELAWEAARQDWLLSAENTVSAGLAI